GRSLQHLLLARPVPEGDRVDPDPDPTLRRPPRGEALRAIRKGRLRIAEGLIARAARPSSGRAALDPGAARESPDRLPETCHWAVYPPSTTSSAPVTKPAPSEARESTASAISSGWARRRSGMWSTIPCITSGSMASRIDVAVGPGNTVFTRMRSRAYSIAALLDMMRTAPLEAWYASAIPWPTSAAIDATCTMDPPPARRIAGIAAFMPRHTPLRLTPIPSSPSGP